MFKKICTSDIQHRTEYAKTLVSSPRKSHGTARKGPKGNNNSTITTGMSYEKRREYFNLPTLAERRTKGDMIST